MKELFNNSETVALRFDSHEDALDFARKCVEDSLRWLVVNSLDFVKRYVEMEMEYAEWSTWR